MTKCHNCGHEYSEAPNSEQKQLWTQMNDLDDKLQFSLFEYGLVLGQTTVSTEKSESAKDWCSKYEEEAKALRLQITLIKRQLQNGASSPKTLQQPC